jgi:hypothetical protein
LLLALALVASGCVEITESALNYSERLVRSDRPAVSGPATLSLVVLGVPVAVACLPITIALAVIFGSGNLEDGLILCVPATPFVMLFGTPGYVLTGASDHVREDVALVASAN